MLTLHTMPRIGWGLLNPSPFCMKVEVYLRLTGAPHTLRPTLSATRAPKGKLPYIDDGGRRIADSTTILEHLRATRGDLLGESAMSPEERAQAHLVQRTFEESLYFVLVSERWRDAAVREAYTSALLAAMPGPIRPVVRRIAQRMLHKQLWQQGYGRHSLEETLARGAADLDAIAAALGARPFFGGESPRGIDACTFAFLANIWNVPVETKLRQHVGRHPRLLAYLERMTMRCATDV